MEFSSSIFPATVVALVICIWRFLLVENIICIAKVHARPKFRFTMTMICRTDIKTEKRKVLEQCLENGSIFGHKYVIFQQNC